MTAYWRAVGIRELTTGTDCEVAANGERGSEGSWAAGVGEASSREPPSPGDS